MLEPRVQAEFDEIRAILRAHAEADQRARERMDRLEESVAEEKKRMDRFERLAAERDRQWYRKLAASEEAWKRRAALADERMDKFDRKLEATRKLVEAGMKIVTRLAADTRELKKSQKAFLDSLKNGRNGHGHRN